MKNKLILITGASGFIGKHLTRRLLESNYELILTCHNNAIDKEFKNYTTQISLDLTRNEDLRKIHPNITAVFHLANFADNNDDSCDIMQKIFNVNSLGTLKLLYRCSEIGVKRFINSSSVSTYGNNKSGYISERSIPKPDSFYGISKFMGELYCERFDRLGKISAISLRYSSVYGVGQKGDTVLPIFINNALKNKDIEIYGKGKKVQDFVYVKDVVEANYLAINSEESGSLNISSGKGINIVSLAKMIKKIFSAKETNIILNAQKSEDNTNYYFDITKANKKLNYTVKYSLKQGLTDYKKNLDSSF